MTRDKQFKRKVREHARRTGRSYASTRRLFTRNGEDAMTHAYSFTKVSKQELGLTVPVPAGWSEFPTIPSSSPYEVARFAYRDHTNHLCIVFRMPGSPTLDPRIPAEQARAKLTVQGYDNFVLADTSIGSRAGVRLAFDKPTPTGVWAARMYFVNARNVIYCLGLGSGDPRDAALFDSMSEAFEIAD